MTRKELLYGMSQKSNDKIGPNDLLGRLAWYKTRAEKLATMTNTKQVILARQTNQDRVTELSKLIADALKGKDAA